jgi:hypothetical protein
MATATRLCATSPSAPNRPRRPRGCRDSDRIAAPAEGLLPLLREVLVHTWSAWSNRLHDAGRDTSPADQLMDLTGHLSQDTRQIAYLRNLAGPGVLPRRATAPPPEHYPRPGIRTVPPPLTPTTIRSTALG